MYTQLVQPVYIKVEHLQDDVDDVDCFVFMCFISIFHGAECSNEKIE